MICAIALNAVYIQTLRDILRHVFVPEYIGEGIFVATKLKKNTSCNLVTADLSAHNLVLCCNKRLARVKEIDKFLIYSSYNIGESITRCDGVVMTVTIYKQLQVV